MARRGFGGKKDKFADLSAEYKDAVAAMATDGVKARIFEAAMAEEENRKAKEDDEDLKDKQEQAKIAGEQYKLASKVNRLKIQFCRRVLQDSGKA